MRGKGHGSLNIPTLKALLQKDCSALKNRNTVALNLALPELSNAIRKKTGIFLCEEKSLYLRKP